MSEWKEKNITDVCDTISDTFRDGADKVILINTSDVLEGKVTNHKLVPNQNLAGQFKKTFRKDDILYSEIRPSNRRYAYVDFEPKDYIASTKLMVLRSKPCVLPKYLYYLLTNNTTIRNLHTIAVGRSGTFPQITYSELANIKFLLPSIEEQEEILAILLDIDDKIAINRRICENLEAQAQALFKHWFIDFAPFKNGKFVESELGMIPEGWRVVTLDEATSKFGTGLNPRQNFKLGCGKNYYVTIKNMIDNRVVLDNKCDFVDDEAIKVIQKRSKLTKGDLLFSGIGTIGRVAMVVDEPLNWNTSESVFNMHPAEGFSTEFIYVLLLSKPLQNYVKTNSQGAVQQGIRMASLKAYKFPYPQYDIKEFNDMIKDIISKKTVIEKECDTLSALRDTLLPKLMSGEIKV